MHFGSYFDSDYEVSFIMFSAYHWIGLIAVIFLCFMLYRSRKAIRGRESLRRGVRWSLVAVLLASEALLQLWYVSEDIWRSGLSLPLELCGITLLLSIIMLITRSRLLYPFLYFTGIAGASIALLTPSLDYAFPHFRFFLFFAAHAAIILASLYMTWIEGYRPTWKSLFYSMLGINLVAAFVWTANYMLDANYMFLMRKPGSFSFLDYFGPYPYYLLVEEMFAFVLFVLMYALFFKRRKGADG